MSTPIVASTTQFLQDAVDKELCKLVARRIGNITLDVALCHPTETPTIFLSANICSVLAEQGRLNTGGIIYLSPKYFLPPDCSMTELDTMLYELPTPIHTLLLHHLQVAAIKGGDRIACNGSRKNTKNKQSDPLFLRLRCQCSRLYSGPKVNKSTGEVIVMSDYRTASIRNDRKNNRPGKAGKSGSHKTECQRSLSKEDQCPFNMSIYKNSKGYYVKGGCPFHEFHARRDNLRLPSKLVNNKEQTLVRDIVNGAHASSGTALRTHFVRSSRCDTPTLFSKDQIKYLCSKNTGSKSSKNAQLESSEWDNIFEHIEKIGGSYVSLLQRVDQVPVTQSDRNVTIRQGVLFNETCINSKLSKKDYPIVTNEDVVAENIADKHRTVRAISDDQEMVVGLAFTTPAEWRQFLLFHTVLHIDATADTNIEGRPLVTVSSKDSNGKMFIVLRAFLPNEQAWAYKWLFQVVFPSILGSKHIANVSMFLTDGDNQEIVQLEQAIKDHFGDKVYRARCSWHIIDRGWLSHVKVPLGGFSGRRRPKELVGKRRRQPKPLTSSNKLARKVYRWIFSWAQPGFCLTAEEYQVSKALFLAFVKSESLKEVMSDDFGNVVTDFLRNHVQHHEQRMCYYNKHSIFHLETHSNTSHEGTNNALKHCAAPVTPQNSMDRAVVTLTDNAGIKAQDTVIQMCSKASATKLWSTSPTAACVTDLCESMLITQWNKSNEYSAFRLNDHRWLVAYKNNNMICDDENPFLTWDDETEEDESNSAGNVKENSGICLEKQNTMAAAKEFGIIPRFKRVYEVIRNPKTLCLECTTCCNQLRMGFPCRHVGCVIKFDTQLTNMYQDGFPLSSVKVFWRQEYYLYGMSTNPDHQCIRQALLNLAANDTNGVYCPMLSTQEQYSVPDHILVTYHAPASARVLNYTNSQVVAAMQVGMDRRNPRRIKGDAAPGYSQTSHFGEDDDDYFEDGHEDIFEENDDHFELMMATENDQAPSPTIRDVLIKEFEDMAEAIQNSTIPQELLKKVRGSIQCFTEEARGNCTSNVITVGKRASMLPPNSKRQKTHGTKHMNPSF